VFLKIGHYRESFAGGCSMKRTTLVSPGIVVPGLVALFALLAPPMFADHLIPAGALISCSTGDSRISSKTTAVGDPILCKVAYRRGDFMMPYGSYLGGELNEFKDPGHFVGKGWMELDFDRVYIGDTAIPIDAKVVDVPGYKIDGQGRILGKGHAVRDTITWMIPILWPIDLINLPRRGPRPTLKAETPMTLRVMEDIRVPDAAPPQRDPYGLTPRGQGADADVPPPPQEQEPVPEQAYAPDPQQMEPDYQPDPPVMAYAPPPVMPYYVAPPPMFYGGVVIGPRAPMVAYGYGPRAYGGIPPVRAYGPRMAVAPRAYAYGYGGRAAAGGAMQARVGGGAALGRGSMATRGAYRGR
jgi:hypothetical protein